ncbi:SMC-Scp complex subunit ScpB [Paradesertivirga mongoliensis]|uniref:SMC-Scp complex subunit ScpB n=1 Tax=Paradesertivirga mongoliensis TaxID=2100740 RepID=A0ABW4ZM91_9SPHI|nr:SMC-Scp complex subunit ScpB [Pedobacter mongoliensis]
MENLELYIEALIFASSQSISVSEIQLVLNAANEQPGSEELILRHIEQIKEKYSNPEFAIELTELNEGYQFLTKKAYYPVINQLQIQRSKKKLSQAAIETLAIIAYRQPITKLEIEQIRGVNCDYTIQKLLDKELIVISGKAESVGKPLLYSTSSLFMDYFGIKNSTELPQINDFQANTNEIGEKQD